MTSMDSGSFLLSMNSDSLTAKSLNLDFAHVPLKNAYKIMAQLLGSIILLIKENLQFINEKFII